MMSLHPWNVVAVNLPEHAHNPIHTDDGAQRAGFPRALVAGVSTYAYLVHPLIDAFGLDWIESGGGELRFRRPIFDGDEVCVQPSDPNSLVVHAVTSEPDQPRAIFEAVREAPTLVPMRHGEPLPEMTFELQGEWGSDYAARLGDDHPLCTSHGIVHPAVWPALANKVFQNHVVRGQWIHTRSIIRHHGLATAGSRAVVRSTVVRRFEKSGERAVADVRIEVDGKAVASLEHEAIIDTGSLAERSSAESA